MNARQKAKKYKKMLDENNKHKGKGYLWLKIDDIRIKPDDPSNWNENRLTIVMSPQTYQIRIGHMVMECTPMSDVDTLITINEKEFNKVYDKWKGEYVDR